MRTEKIKDVSARVVLTPMPEDGVEQFTFMKHEGSLTTNRVEALLEFSDNVDPKELFSCLNKLLGAHLNNGYKDFSVEDGIALEHTYNYILNCWRAETDTFEMMHPKFLAGKQE